MVCHDFPWDENPCLQQVLFRCVRSLAPHPGEDLCGERRPSGSPVAAATPRAPGSGSGAAAADDR